MTLQQAPQSLSGCRRRILKILLSHQNEVRHPSNSVQGTSNSWGHRKLKQKAFVTCCFSAMFKKAFALSFRITQLRLHALALGPWRPMPPSEPQAKLAHCNYSIYEYIYIYIIIIIYIYIYNYIYLRRGDESQPRARIFLFRQRNVVVAYAMIEVITPNVLLQSRMNRNPNHLQHLWKTSPCFATLRSPLLSISSHPLANYLVPNPNGRCSPLSFGVPPFSSIFTMCLRIFLRLLSFFSNVFPAVPPLSSVFLLRNLP